MRQYLLELPHFTGQLTPGEAPRNPIAYTLILYSPQGLSITAQDSVLPQYLAVLPHHLAGLQEMGAFACLDVYVIVDDVLADTTADLLFSCGWPASRLLTFRYTGVQWWLRRLEAMRHPYLRKHYTGVLHCDIGMLPRRYVHYDFTETAAWCPTTHPYAFSKLPLRKPSTYHETDMFWASKEHPENWNRFAAYVGDTHLRKNWNQRAKTQPHYRIHGFHFGMAISRLHAPELSELLEACGDIYEGDEGMIALYLFKHRIQNSECFVLPEAHLQYLPHGDIQDADDLQAIKTLRTYGWENRA